MKYTLRYTTVAVVRSDIGVQGEVTFDVDVAVGTAVNKEELRQAISDAVKRACKGEYTLVKVVSAKQVK